MCVLNGTTPTCWGNNKQWQLGFMLPPDETSTKTEIAAIPPALALFVGARRMCSLAAGGETWCWGETATAPTITPGGNNPAVSPLLPAVVEALAGATRIAMSPYHACARMADGLLYCWGWNAFGQLGDGTTTSRTTPELVPLPCDAI